jgi:hypothetical protein
MGLGYDDEAFIWGDVEKCQENERGQKECTNP